MLAAAVMASAMQAVVIQGFGPPGEVEIKAVPMPPSVCEPGSLLVKVASAGCNPIDTSFIRGYVNQMFPCSLPCTLGWDFAGQVMAVGEDVQAFGVGDEIICYFSPDWSSGQKQGSGEGNAQGCFAEYMSVRADQCAPKPTNVPADTAGCIASSSLTALEGLLDHGGLESGQRVLILAASGGVGSFAVQIAKWKGAEVIGVCSGANSDYVRALGADNVIDYTSTEDLASAVLASCPTGVDLVLDCVGGDSTRVGFQCLRPDGGRLVSIANFGVAKIGEELGKQGKTFAVRPSGARLAEVTALFENGDLVLPEVRSFPLANARDAFAQIESRRTRGKLVLLPSH